jgi:predicted transcriptional regulator
MVVSDWYRDGVAMTLRLTDEQDALLARLADAQQISKQEAVVRAIEAHAERVATAQDVKQWADFALVRYAALLERLAQ